jgi:hypothetical protein
MEAAKAQNWAIESQEKKKLVHEYQRFSTICGGRMLHRKVGIHFKDHHAPKIINLSIKYNVTGRKI